jgi:hypothetical protein
VEVVVGDAEHDRDRPREAVGEMHRLQDRVVVVLGLEAGEGAEGARREHLQVGELALADRQQREVRGFVAERLGVRARDQKVDEGTAVRRDRRTVFGHGRAFLRGVGAGYGTGLVADLRRTARASRGPMRSVPLRASTAHQVCGPLRSRRCQEVHDKRRPSTSANC